MRKIVFALIATSVFGWLVAGMATTASAHHSRPGCAACAPVAPTTIYKTVHPQRYEMRYRDVSVSRHVTKVHRITTVTRVQPIIHIHQVTRVHHHTIVSIRDAYRRTTQYLHPIRMMSYSTQHSFDCGCRP